MDNKNNTKENVITKSIFNIYDNLDKMTLKNIELYDNSYKLFINEVIKLQEELDNTSKYNKKQREFLKQQIKDYQELADINLKNYIEECNELYDLDKKFFSDIIKEDKNMETRPNHRPNKPLKTDIKLKDQYYTIEEVAEILKVHHTTIRRAIKQNRLPAFKIGTKWLIKKETITNL